jgi:hypothetical protein
MWLLASFELSAMKRKLKADAKPMRRTARVYPRIGSKT